MSPFEVRRRTRQQQKILLKLNKINNKALQPTFDEQQSKTSVVHIECPVSSARVLSQSEFISPHNSTYNAETYTGRGEDPRPAGDRVLTSYIRMSASDSGHEENDDKISKQNSARSPLAKLPGCHEHTLRDNSTLGPVIDEALKPRMTSVSPIKYRGD